mmetsp:Transcript_31958/g.74847  ORF Transcript_31958/g.74847 Transcript_31958/m.74847 type:complete len:269 (+) Transcript_31958:244-1050(+)
MDAGSLERSCSYDGQGVVEARSGRGGSAGTTHSTPATTCGHRVHDADGDEGGDSEREQAELLSTAEAAAALGSSSAIVGGRPELRGGEEALHEAAPRLLSRLSFEEMLYALATGSASPIVRDGDRRPDWDPVNLASSYPGLSDEEIETIPKVCFREAVQAETADEDQDQEDQDEHSLEASVERQSPTSAAGTSATAKRSQRTAKGTASSGVVTSASAPSTTCSICLEAFVDGIQLSRPRCQHIFHEACLKEWLHRATQCPLCRAAVIA